MIRQPAVAGQFYPGSPRELRSTIRGLVDETAPQEDVIGYYAPHAGYMYSGSVAGAVVSRVRPAETYVVLGPNHTGMGAAFSIMSDGSWRTPLGDVEIDGALARRILAGSGYLKEDAAAHLREHAIEVQLPFIQYFKPDFRLVPITLSHADAGVYADIGNALAQAITESGKRVVIVASGDMTHYESAGSARAKDMQAIEAMLALGSGILLERVRRLGITMCGYGPAAVLIYAANQLGADKADLVKYMTSGDVTGDTSSVVGYAGVVFKRGGPPQQNNPGESAQVRLARETVETYVRTRQSPEVKDTPVEMHGRAGVFVSIHKGGNLRGCIGTIAPTQADIAHEIVQNAISAATRDPRFPAVNAAELPLLEYKVDVLTEPQPVQTEKELDAKRYGVIVEAGWRRGLLLPDLEGVESVEHQIEICRAKAGIAYNEPVKLYRFEVVRYT